VRRGGYAWQPDTTATCCNSCRRPFDLMLRRHHCRKCGLVFCDGCAPGSGDGRACAKCRAAVAQAERLCAVGIAVLLAVVCAIALGVFAGPLLTGAALGCLVLGVILLCEREPAGLVLFGLGASIPRRAGGADRPPRQ